MLRFVRPGTILSLLLTGPVSAGQSAKALYETSCAACHQRDGSGGPNGASLRGPLKHGADLKSIQAVIEHGIPGTLMPPFKDLKNAQREALARYVLAMNRKGSGKSK